MTRMNAIGQAMKHADLPPLEAVTIVVTNGNRVLWQQRRDTLLWCLPGGKVDADESPYQAAVRELKEETNIQAETLDYLGSDRSNTGLLVHAFRCDFRTCPTDFSEIGSHNDPDAEARQFAWATPGSEEWAKILRYQQHPYNIGLLQAGLA